MAYCWNCKGRPKTNTFDNQKRITVIQHILLAVYSIWTNAYEPFVLVLYYVINNAIAKNMQLLFESVQIKPSKYVIQTTFSLPLFLRSLVLMCSLKLVTATETSLLRKKFYIQSFTWISLNNIHISSWFLKFIIFLATPGVRIIQLANILW